MFSHLLRTRQAQQPSYLPYHGWAQKQWRCSCSTLVGFKNELVRAHKDGVNHMLFLNKDNVATSTFVHMFQALGVLGIGALSVGAVVGLAGLAAAAAGIEAGAGVVYGSAETLFTIPEEAMALEGSRLQVLFGNLFGDDMIELDHLVENEDKENGPATHSDHAIKPGRAIERRVSAKATDDEFLAGYQYDVQMEHRIRTKSGNQ